MMTRPRYYLSVFVILACTKFVYAQDITNGTNLFIPAGLELHIDGDVANSGFIQNQGSFFITGNWRNANVYQGFGTIVLNGAGEQDFTNNENAVFHLMIDGGRAKHIIGKLPITNRLSLVSGVVLITDADTLLLSETANISGGSADSYVDGAFTYTGTGYKFFPIGKNGNYFPVELLNITGINPVTQLEVFEDVPALNTPPAVNVYSRVYWERKNISGTFNGSPVAIGYPVPDGYTNRHVIDILQADAINLEFSTMSNVNVSSGDDLAKISSGSDLTGTIFVLGESIPVDGIPGEFYLSTSLSPNAVSTDNQFVRVFGNQLVEDNFQFLVYNRWGLVVYENTSLQSMITSGWDGRQKSGGNILPSGAYPFILRAKTKTGESFEKKGIISIVN